MDDLDIGIIGLLNEDARLSNAEIGRRLGVSEGAVRQRLRRLIDGRILRIQPMLNMERFREWLVAVMGLSIEGRQLESCAEQINKLPEVLCTRVVAGQFDLLVTLLVESHNGLTDFVTRKLASLPGIRNSETFVCLKQCDPWISVDAAVAERMGKSLK